MKQRLKKLLTAAIILASIASNLQYLNVQTASFAKPLAVDFSGTHQVKKNRAQQPALQVLPVVRSSALEPTIIQVSVLPSALNILSLQSTASQQLLVSVNSSYNMNSSTAVANNLAVHQFISSFTLQTANSSDNIEHPQYAENIPNRAEAMPIVAEYAPVYTDNKFSLNVQRSQVVAATKSEGFAVLDKNTVLRC